MLAKYLYCACAESIMVTKAGVAKLCLSVRSMGSPSQMRATEIGFAHLLSRDISPALPDLKKNKKRHSHPHANQNCFIGIGMHPTEEPYRNLSQKVGSVKTSPAGRVHETETCLLGQMLKVYK